MKRKYYIMLIVFLAIFAIILSVSKIYFGQSIPFITDVNKNPENMNGQTSDDRAARSRASFQEEFQNNIAKWNSEKDNDYLLKQSTDLFNAWFASYPDDAFAATAQLKFRNYRYAAMLKCIGRVNKTVEDIHRLADKLLIDRQDFYNFEEQLVAKHDTTDFHSPEKFINSKIDDVSLKTLFYKSWCEKSPIDAAISINRLDPQTGRQVIGDFATKFAKIPLKNFKEINASNPDSNSLKVIASYMLLEQLKNDNTSELQNFLQSDSSFKQQSKQVIEVMSRKDPQLLFDHWDFLLKNDYLDVKSPYMVRTVYNLVTSNADVVNEFYTKMITTKQDNAVIASQIAEAYVYTDLEKAAEWIIQLPDGAAKTASVEPLLIYLQEHKENAEYAKWKQYQTSLKEK